MTLYAACLSRLGLTQAGAAALHGNSIETIKKRCQGKLGVPQGCWDELRAYEAQIIDGSEGMREAWEQAGSPPLEINDAEAGAVAVMALADFVLGSTGPVHVGETAATRAARSARVPK